MRSLYIFLNFVICFNLLFSFMTLEEKGNNSSKESTKLNLTWEEFMEKIKKSGKPKSWEIFCSVLENGGSEEIFNEPFEGEQLLSKSGN